MLRDQRDLRIAGLCQTDMFVLYFSMVVLGYRVREIRHTWDIGTGEIRTHGNTEHRTRNTGNERIQAAKSKTDYGPQDVTHCYSHSIIRTRIAA